MSHLKPTLREDGVTPVSWHGSCPRLSQPGSLAPFQVFSGQEERWHNTRPVCVRESLEAALHSIPFVGWWEVRDRTGRAVASHSRGILDEFGPGSLLARQILSTLPMVGKAYESVGDIEVETTAWSGTETEDGAEIRWTKLPETRGSGTAARPVAGSRWVKARPVRPPVSFEVELWPHHPAVSVTIRHKTGWLKVIDHRFLELRAAKIGRDGMPRWDLAILNARRDDGKPGETAKGICVGGLSLEEFLELGSLGVAVKEAKDSDAPLKTWRPGMVSTRNGSGDGNESNRVEYPGWVRGVYGIDKRAVEIKVPMYGGGEWIDRRPRYHLTHLPSGYLIVALRRRNLVEQVADALVEQVPELGGGVEIAEGAASKAGAVIEAMKTEAGFRWDR